MDEEQRFYAIIERMAENLADLKRIRWPARWPAADNSEVVDSLEEANLPSTSADFVHRIKIGSLTPRKMTGLDEFKNCFNVDNTADPEKDELKLKIKILEEELALRNMQSTASLSIEDVKLAVSEVLEERDRQTEEKFKVIISETISEVMSDHLCKLEHAMRTIYVPASQGCQCSKNLATSGTITGEERRVAIGAGYSCQESAYNCLKTAVDDNDWAVALLVGVFGEEVAKKLRVYPRKEGLIKFPIAFLTLAKDLFRERIKKRYTDKEKIEEVIKNVPAWLADKALDLNGPRRLHSRAKGGGALRKRKGQEPATTPKVRKTSPDGSVTERRPMEDFEDAEEQIGETEDFEEVEDPLGATESAPPEHHIFGNMLPAPL